MSEDLSEEIPHKRLRVEVPFYANEHGYILIGEDLQRGKIFCPIGIIHEACVKRYGNAVGPIMDNSFSIQTVSGGPTDYQVVGRVGRSIVVPEGILLQEFELVKISLKLTVVGAE